MSDRLQLALLRLVGREEVAPPSPTPEDPDPIGSIIGQLRGNLPPAQAMENNEVTPRGLELLKKHEGLKLAGYYATEAEKADGLVTVGYGSTKRVGFGEEITPKQAEQFLLEDVQVAEAAVDRLVRADLTPNQRDALVSLVYNVGEGAFGRSKALKALNAGDLDTFRREAFSPEVGFVFQNKERLRGLVNRRREEQELFDSE